MKKLNEFVRFDFEAFQTGKTFAVTGVREWCDFDSKQHLGTIVETVITKDTTVYKQKDGEEVTNLFEKVAFKVKKDLGNSIPIRSTVVPVNPVGVIYGQYRNQLSVKCDDIQIVTPNTSSAKTPLTRREG